MKIKNVIDILEELAPPSLQESYDNAGLIVGNDNTDLTGVLICLDSIEAVIDEAIEKKCNLVVAHHPIVFSGLKRLNGKNYIERVIIKAIKNDVAIYAIHTNLDNVLAGVNGKFADQLGLVNRRILAPKSGMLNKVTFYVPKANAEEVKGAVFKAGAGCIGNYSECSFSVEGIGTFKGNSNANPHIGKVGERHLENEIKVEVVCENYKLNKVIPALLSAHPYEEVAYDVYDLENSINIIGSGMVGELEKPMKSKEFLQLLKTKMNTECIRYTNLCKDEIKTIALCGGAGSFLLNNAKRAKADIFITGDYKYHQFFDADNEIIIADIGHYESEQYTSELLKEYLTKKIIKFAVRLTEINTNPVNYI